MTQKVFHQYFWMKPTTARPATTTTMTTPTARPAPTTTTTTSEATATTRQEFLWQMPGQVEQLLGLSFRPNEMLETISSEQNSDGRRKSLFSFDTDRSETWFSTFSYQRQKNCNFFLQHLIPFWRQFLSKKPRSQYWSKFSWPTAAWKLIFPRKSNLLFCNWKEKWKWPLRFFRNQVKMSRNKTLKAYLLFPEWLFKLVALNLMIIRKKTLWTFE